MTMHVGASCQLRRIQIGTGQWNPGCSSHFDERLAATLHSGSVWTAMRTSCAKICSFGWREIVSINSTSLDDRVYFTDNDSRLQYIFEQFSTWTLSMDFLPFSKWCQCGMEIDEHSKEAKSKTKEEGEWSIASNMADTGRECYGQVEITRNGRRSVAQACKSIC